MSLSRCCKSTDQPHLDIKEIENKHVILLDDSKGRYIQEVKDSIVKSMCIQHLQIEWHIKSLSTIKNGLTYLEQLLKNVGKDCVVLLRYGTCDFTTLNKDNRHLKPSFISVSQASEYFNRELLKLSGITRTSDSTIVLLEIPPISINAWNTCKSCDKSEEASNHDINQQIDAVNSLIRTFNQENSGISSPRFGLDLEIERKNKNKTA